MEVVFDGRGAANSPPFYIEAEVLNATVGLNGFYEADTFSMSIDQRLLPFDPDQIAHATCRIYMWDSQKDLSESEWAVENNEMIRGIIDDIESEIIGESNSVKFTGRDYTAILLDTEWDPKDKVDAGGGLDEVVQGIADRAAPEGTRARFQVVWNGLEDPPPVGGLHRSTKKKGLWVKPGKSYWDVIWDLCIQHAYVPRVVGSQIIIEEPITQTRQSLTMAPRLVYGKHLTKLAIKRKFGREKVPQIIITAWDPFTQKVLTVKYPAKKNIVVGAIGSTDALGIPLTVKKDEEMFFPAPKGITDEAALKRYARMKFYQLGRGETMYNLSTSHIWIDGDGVSNDGNPEPEVNLLQLRPGYAVGIDFDPFDQAYLRTLEYGQRVEFILNLGYQPVIAAFIAENVDKLELFKQEYYHSKGNVEYDHESGIEIQFETTNFASEVREIAFARETDPEAA